MSRWRAITVAATLWVTTPGFARQAADVLPPADAVASPWEVVLTADDLTAAGVSRLGDALFLAPGVRLTTLDGFTLSPSLGATGAAHQRRWALTIDGRPVEAGVMDVYSLNALPLAVSDVEEIRIRLDPHTARGRVYPGGRIEIRTAYKRTGSRIRAGLSAANETGDPGPFRYVRPDLRLSNVDKSGPDGSLSGETGNSSFRVRAGAVAYQLIPSDPAVFDRNYRAYDGGKTPEMLSVAPRFELERRGDSGSLRAGVEGAHFDDMMFSRTVGREIPTRYRRIGVHADADQSVSEQLSVHGSFLASRVRLSDVARASRFPVEWNQLTVEGLGTVGWRTGGFAAEAGLRLEMQEVNTDSSGAPPNTLAGYTVFVEAGNRGTVDIHASLAIARLEGRTFPALSGRLGTQLKGPNRLDLLGTVARVHERLASPAAYWLGRGARPLPDVEAAVASIGQPLVVSADAVWSRQSASGWVSELAVMARHMGQMPDVMGPITPDDEGFRSEALSLSALSLRTLGVRAAVGTTRGPISGRLHFSWYTPAGGAAVAVEAMRSLPARRLRFEASFRPVPTFGLHTAIGHYSASSWIDYAQVLASSPYDHRVPGHVKWDLTLTKSLFSGRLMAVVGFENLLNDYVAYHPIGASFDRTLRIQMNLRLD